MGDPLGKVISKGIRQIKTRRKYTYLPSLPGTRRLLETCHDLETT